MRIVRPARTRLPLLVALIAAWALAAAGCGGGDGDSGNGDVLTSEGFERALDAVSEEAGEDARALRIELGTTGAQFQLVEDGEGRGFFYTGEQLEPVELQIVGSPSLESSLFALSDADPGAVDSIVEGIREETGDDGARVTSLTLQMHVDGELGWTANAESEGRSGLVFEAEADGSGVTQASGLPGSDGSETGGESVEPG